MILPIKGTEDQAEGTRLHPSVGKENRVGGGMNGFGKMTAGSWAYYQATVVEGRENYFLGAARRRAGGSVTALRG